MRDQSPEVMAAAWREAATAVELRAALLLLSEDTHAVGAYMRQTIALVLAAMAEREVIHA